MFFRNFNEEDQKLYQALVIEGKEIVFMKSFYVGQTNNRGENPWKGIWKTEALPELAFYSWCAFLNSILTLDNLKKRDLFWLIDMSHARKENVKSFAYSL